MPKAEPSYKKLGMWASHSSQPTKQHVSKSYEAESNAPKPLPSNLEKYQAKSKQLKEVTNHLKMLQAKKNDLVTGVVRASPFLRQLFISDVNKEIQKYKQIAHDLNMDLLMFEAGSLEI